MQIMINNLTNLLESNSFLDLIDFLLKNKNSKMKNTKKMT